MEIRKQRGTADLAARIGLVAGGLVCLAITPALASAYYFAYGRSEGEAPPPDWLDGIGWSSWFSGSGAISTYNKHGLVFGLALLVFVISLGVVVAPRRRRGRLERRAWWMIIVGLGAVSVGSLMSYGIPEDVFDSGNGFGLSLLGFLVIAVGTAVLGWAVRRETGVSRIQSIGIALVGPVGIVAGTVLVEHLPSGPAFLLIVAGIIIGAAGLPTATRT